MKLTIRRVALEKLLTTIYEAVPAQTAEASFKNFLFTIDEKEVSIIASDSNITIKGEIDLSNPHNDVLDYSYGAIQIPAKYLFDIVKKLQSEVITIELVDESIINISDETSQFNLKVIDAKEYPDIDLSLESNQSTYFAVATKGQRQLFCGINITANEGKLIFVATDSYRLARRYTEISSNESFSITVPLKTLATISRIDTKDDVEIFIEIQKVIFKIGSFTIASKLYSGEFPNIDRIIPTNINYTLDVNAKEFISAIDRITIVGNTRIMVSCSLEKVELSSKDTNIGSSKEKLKDAKYLTDKDYPFFSIIFNSANVKDAIQALNSERVKLEFVTDARAFLISSDDPKTTQVVTPIRSLGE